MAGLTMIRNTHANWTFDDLDDVNLTDVWPMSQAETMDIDTALLRTPTTTHTDTIIIPRTTVFGDGGLTSLALSDLVMQEPVLDAQADINADPEVLADDDKPMQDVAETQDQPPNPQLSSQTQHNADDDKPMFDIDETQDQQPDPQASSQTQHNADDTHMEEADFQTLFGDHGIHNFSHPLMLGDDYNPDMVFGPGFMITDDAEQPHHRHELRPAARVDLSYFNVQDHDETENYDPIAEEQKLRAEIRRRRQIRRRLLDAVDDQSGEESDNTPGEPPVLPTLPVIVQFKSDDIKERFKALDEQQRAAAIAANDPANGYRFRDRSRRSTDAQRLQNDDDTQDHLGHPVARGCRHCKEFGEHCSLLEDEYTWPCQLCTTEGCDCIKIIPPVRKLECLSCKRRSKQDRSLVCSFLWEDDHSAACRCCRDHSLQCIAEEDPDHIHNRVRYSDDGAPYVIEQPPARKRRLPRSCVECQKAYDVCSFNKSGGAECEYCKLTGKTCVPISIGPAPRQRAEEHEESLFVTEESECESEHDDVPPQTVFQRMPPQMVSSAPQQRPVQGLSGLAILAQRRAQGQILRLLYIKTHFCHPMVFAHSATERDPCAFCRDQRFQYFGHGFKLALVRELPNGVGWREVKGGHAEDGRRPTKLCLDCSLKRLEIIVCEHSIRRINKVVQISPEIAVQQLEDGHSQHVYCSVCIAIARWECCKPDAENKSGARGCGLVFCEVCFVHFKACNNNLTTMLKEFPVDQRSIYRPCGGRADGFLLSENGPLFKTLSNIGQ